MTFDQIYDEMLGHEFSARGQHVKAATVQPGVAAAAGEISTHARHAKAEHVDVDGVASSERERPTGLARYRNAALVGAGGLACATVGALLGGLGGYFTVSPAGAHAIASTSADGPSTPAAHHSSHATDSTATPALPATGFSPVSGGLTQAGSGVGSITASPSPNSPLPGVPVPGGPVAGGSGSGGSGTTGVGSTGGGGNGNGTTTPTIQTTPPPPPPTCQSVSIPVVGCVTSPSVPVPTPTVPSVPITTPTSPVPLPVSVQTSPTTSGGTSTTVTATAPVSAPTAPTTTTVGPVSVGTSSGSGSTSGGLTLNLG